MARKYGHCYSGFSLRFDPVCLLRAVSQSTLSLYLAVEIDEKIFVPKRSEGEKRKIQNFAAQNLIAGSLAGATAVVFTYPLDLIRARLASQIGPGRYRNSFQGLASMYREEGLRSWYKGHTYFLSVFLKPS